MLLNSLAMSFSQCPFLWTQNFNQNTFENPSLKTTKVCTGFAQWTYKFMMKDVVGVRLTLL